MNYESSSVLCPFYQKSDNKTITCEGITDKETTNTRKFALDFRKKEYFNKFCCGCYCDCPIAEILVKKYPI